MENNYEDPRRTRPDERQYYQQSSRPRRPDERHQYQPTNRGPRPQYGYPQRPPPLASASPRNQQYRPRQAHPHAQYERPPPPRHPDHYVNRGNPSRPDFNHYNNGQSRHQADNRPPPGFRSRAHRVSHISALTSSQADMDSGPISEIGSDSIASPTFMPPTPDFPPDREDDDHSVRGLSEEKEVVPSAIQARHESRPRLAAVRESDTLPSSDRTIITAPMQEPSTFPPNSQAATVEALANAIRQGLGTSNISSRSETPKAFADINTIRMPFGGEPESPTSIYTDMTGSQARQSMPLSSYQGYERRDSRPSIIIEQEIETSERSTYTSDQLTPNSHISTYPIVNNDTSGMSSRVPVSKRPPKLDMNAVRDAEARGSLTSLSDLIKRATRVASNLDRGKTASKFGDLDFWGSGERVNGGRNSTVSDVLNAFPSPGNSKRNTLWPAGGKQFMASKSSLGQFVETAEKPKRRCCGLPLWLFVLILVTGILIIAAAVLVPLFLIVIPRMHKVDPAQCPTQKPCHNGGISIVANEACSCICVNGFTGSDCSAETDPDCMTASLSDGSNTYSNVTVGTSVLPILQNREAIPLNLTSILSTFASNNLSCASENSLVDFDGGSTHTKRFVIVPGMVPTEPHFPALNLPSSESGEHNRFEMFDGAEPENLHLFPTHTLPRRQDATQSANGIVYATSSQAGSSTPTSSASSNSANATATSSGGTSAHTNKITATDKQLNFAAAIVLYLLETTSQINVAVSANQAITTFFENSATTNHTVEVVTGSQSMSANFDTLEITFSNGTKLGGS